ADKAASLLEEATKQMNVGKFSRAFTVLKDLLATDPTHHEGRRLLATLLLKFGNLVTAKNAFDSLLKEAFQRQDYELAESLLREYLAVGPRCVSFIEMLGEVYERKGDPIAAVIEYEKAIKVLVDDPDSEGTSHARELYAKVKSLAPGSFVVGRLAPKFEVASPPLDHGPEGPPPIPPSPLAQESPPVTVLVSDAIVESYRSQEDTSVPEKSSVLVTDVPVVENPAQAVDADPSPLPTEASADLPPLRYAKTAEVVTPEPPVTEATDASVSSSLRYATEDLPATPPPSVDGPDQPVEVPSLRFVAPVEAEQPQPTLSDEPHSGNEEEKIPFPPVNQMPLSASVADSLTLDMPDPMAQSAVQADHASEAPFWEKAEESAVTPTPAIMEEGSVEIPVPVTSKVEEPNEVPVSTTQDDMDHTSTPVSSDIDSLPYREEPISESITVFEQTGQTHETVEDAPLEEKLPEAPAEFIAQAEEITQEPALTWRRSKHDHFAHPEPSDTAPEDARRPTAPAPSRPRRRKGPSLMMRMRVRVSILTRRCVTTAGSVTRLVLFLTASLVILAVLGVGVTAIAWLGMEEKPADLYRELTKVAPPRSVDDPLANGYVLLMGFEVGPQANPLQEGHDRWLSPGTRIEDSCVRPDKGGEETQPLSGWFRSGDPAAQFKSEDRRLNEWVASESVFMNRYRQWLVMAFDDWGYGYMGSPDCAHILRVHRLFVADGFPQDVNKGLDRLETDLTAWRTVLAQAKTLSMKSMAVEAIRDDVAVMSGLLSRPALENKAAQRIVRLARPLDPDERSLRWPMQNEFMLEVKRADSRLHIHADVDSGAMLAVKRMPVPKQRTLNAYAKYYDALIKNPQTRGSTPPKLYDFARTPAHSRVDSFINPLDNLLRTEPMADWEHQIGVIMETDARLRLAGLQSRLRGTSSEQQVLAKTAQAGPTFYDPFTELPMLLNTAQGRLYSVGPDAKDDGGDPTFDISVPIVIKEL
ncbi:MAG: tetratricopeptide repeat protein, partial [Nitrospiraceae bacterium]